MELYKEKERSYIEVESIKSKLVKVEELLHQAQKEKKFAQQEQERLSSELAGLKEELRLWEGKIKDLSERKLVLGRKAASSKELAQRIWDLKVKTQQEVDRQELEAGNCGYIVKEGKPTFTRDKVIELKKIIVSHPKQK
jgi:chromosome segregation ATPase